MSDSINSIYLNEQADLVDKASKKIFDDINRTPQKTIDLLSTITRFQTVFSKDLNQQKEKVADFDQAILYLTKQLKHLGLEKNMVDQGSDGSRTIRAEQIKLKNAPTILLYSHYDVQPAGDLSLWKHSPFTLTRINDRYFARGAADCKGNIVAHLLALEKIAPILSELDLNIKVVFEGSEEVDGFGLDELIKRRPDWFQAEIVLIMDAGDIEFGTPTLITSLRGSVDVVLEVETLAASVHSGLFGGVAPDALAVLIDILARLKTSTGLLKITNQLPKSQLKSDFIYEFNKFRLDSQVLPQVRLNENKSITNAIWHDYALTVTGLKAPNLDAPGAIPDKASAKINLRTPADINTDQAQRLLIKTLQEHNPLNARLNIIPGKSNPGFTTQVNSTNALLMKNIMEKIYNKSVVNAGMGGSIPLCNTLRKVNPAADFFLLGVEDPLCNIHGPNESVALSSIHRIAAVEAVYLAAIGGKLLTLV